MNAVFEVHWQVYSLCYKFMKCCSTGNEIGAKMCLAVILNI